MHISAKVFIFYCRPLIFVSTWPPQEKKKYVTCMYLMMRYLLLYVPINLTCIGCIFYSHPLQLLEQITFTFLQNGIQARYICIHKSFLLNYLLFSTYILHNISSFQGSLNKFHGQHALRERARKLDQGILIIR